MKVVKIVILLVLLGLFLIFIAPQISNMFKSSNSAEVKAVAPKRVEAPERVEKPENCLSTAEMISASCEQATPDKRKCGMATQKKITDCKGNVTYETVDASNCVAETVFDTIPCNNCGTMPIYGCPVGNPPPSSVGASQIAKYNNAWMWAGACSVENASACQ